MMIYTMELCEVYFFLFIIVRRSFAQLVSCASLNIKSRLAKLWCRPGFTGERSFGASNSAAENARSVSTEVGGIINTVAEQNQNILLPQITSSRLNQLLNNNNKLIT